MIRNVSHGYGLALAVMGLGLVVVVGVACGGASKSADSVAPRVAAPPADVVAVLGPASRLDALIREEFAGLTNEGVARLQLADVRQEADGSYRVALEFASDEVAQGTDEKEVIPARKRLMEERMQHAYRTLYTSGIDVNTAIVSAKFRADIADWHQQGVASEGYRVVYTTWMSREKAAGVNWGDPSLDLRTVWEAPVVHPSYR